MKASINSAFQIDLFGFLQHHFTQSIKIRKNSNNDEQLAEVQIVGENVHLEGFSRRLAFLIRKRRKYFLGEAIQIGP